MQYGLCGSVISAFFFFQAEDGIRDLVRSRGLGDVYKRQGQGFDPPDHDGRLALVGGGYGVAPLLWLARRQQHAAASIDVIVGARTADDLPYVCLLYTSDAADERSSVDFGGRRVINKKKQTKKRKKK